MNIRRLLLLMIPIAIGFALFKTQADWFVDFLRGLVFPYQGTGYLLGLNNKPDLSDAFGGDLPPGSLFVGLCFGFISIVVLFILSLVGFVWAWKNSSKPKAKA